MPSCQEHQVINIEINVLLSLLISDSRLLFQARYRMLHHFILKIVSRMSQQGRE